ncbi:discoidin domain-containing protein, partial [Streptomyces sp. NPDC057674]|uniref:discoidin domain-containing protein n=1 Tax=Streptomyces sp. NPDC057674 TaxID=3346203 RepID=UPI00367F6C62
MRGKTLSWRLTIGVLIAGLIAVGLLPVTAYAAAATNLALGRTATASGAHGAYPAGNVTDGGQQSYWEGPAGAFPQWVQVDLGAGTRVDSVVLKLPTTWEARSQTVAVLGSTDGSTFTTLATPQSRAFDPSASNTVTVGVTSTTTRYVRVQVTANTGWNAAQLSEVEVYGESGGGPVDPPPTGTNLARNKPIEASSTTQTYVAANANDDSTTSYWESAGLPADLTVKLGANADVTAVVVKLNPAQVWGPRTQAIQVLGREQAASGFTSLKARADYVFTPSTGQNTVTIPVSGRYADLRLTFFSNTGAPGAQVAEFQVVGAAAPGPDLTVTDLTWSPSTPSETDAVTVNATVRNAGTAAAAATTVEVSVEGAAAGSAQVGALAAGASATVPVTVGKRPVGSYTVSAVVDPTDTVPEQDNGNNSRTAATKLVVGQSPGPDLRVTGITSNPTSPAVGSAVTFTVAVQNRGTTTAAATVTRLTAGGTTLNGATGTIAAGQT